MSKKRKHTPWLVIAAISISILAGLGAYKGARLLADEITTDAEKQAEKAGLFKPEGIEDDMSKKLVNGEGTVEKLRPMNLIYSVNYETGKIEKLAVQIFDTVSMKVSFVYFDPEITYTMTGTLYRSLANGNVLVPQTVRLSELYSYYGNASAFDAGRRIISEGRFSGGKGDCIRLQRAASEKRRKRNKSYTCPGGFFCGINLIYK